MRESADTASRAQITRSRAPALTVPAAAKTRQEHDYPSREHRISYALRTGSERTFSTIKDPAATGIARGWCRLTGLTPLSAEPATERDDARHAAGRGWPWARCWCRSGRDRRSVSARRWSSTAAAGWRRRHDLPADGAPGRDNDQLPVTGAHCEGSGVSLLKNAEDVGDHLAATSRGPAPPDHDPLADIGEGEPDL